MVIGVLLPDEVTSFVIIIACSLCVRAYRPYQTIQIVIEAITGVAISIGNSGLVTGSIVAKSGDPTCRISHSIQPVARGIGKGADIAIRIPFS